MVSENRRRYLVGWSIASAAHVKAYGKAYRSTEKALVSRAISNRAQKYPSHVLSIKRAKKHGTWQRIPIEEVAQILDLYDRRDALTAETGIVHHVDHRTPIFQGGRHRLDNLQILTAAEHTEKTRQEFTHAA